MQGAVVPRGVPKLSDWLMVLQDGCCVVAALLQLPHMLVHVCEMG